MPLSQRLGIIGLGLVGGSLALALRRARPALRILGVDVDLGALEEAKAAHAIDASAPPATAPLAECDVVVLAQPAIVVRWHRAFLLTTAPVGEIPTRVAIGRVSFRLRCGRCWL